MFDSVRFLITQPTVAWINGSTMLALELAHYLQAQGALVTVYTWLREDPGASLFDGINVVSDLGADLHLDDFDYVWVHSQVLPKTMLDELETSTRRPTFIFMHMSPLGECADEWPFIEGLEVALSDLSVFNSEETRQAQKLHFSEDAPTALYPNPAPSVFSRVTAQEYPSFPRKVLVVSNHIPDEVAELRALLTSTGVTMVFLGKEGDNYEMVTPELLERYDLIVTIGKTVQYCLVSGTPVFVYDHFGGPGYLTAENFDATAEKNFSGRGFSQRSAVQLKDEVMRGYAPAVAFQHTRLSDLQDKYVIDRVLTPLLSTVSTKNIHQPLSQVLVETAKLNLFISRFRFLHMADSRNFCAALKREADRFVALEGEIRQLKREHEEFLDLRSQRALRRLQGVLSRLRSVSALASRPLSEARQRVRGRRPRR